LEQWGFQISKNKNKDFNALKLDGINAVFSFFCYLYKKNYKKIKDSP
jgi:hypothetical protein